MRSAFLFAITFLLTLNSNSQESNFSGLPYAFPIEQLEKERGKVNYDLNKIIRIIEDSVHFKDNVIIPEGANAFERLLFTARRIQHHDSQLVAINLMQYLLEFEYYRSRGEELYIEMLLAKSLDYIGADLLAYERLNNVFPELVEYVKDPFFQGFFLDLYADVLVDIEKYEEAIRVYREILLISYEAKDSLIIYDIRNNLGFTFGRMGNLDSAAYYLRANQDPSFRLVNPTLYAFAFGNFAQIFFERGQYDSAIHYCKIEERILKEIDTEEGLHRLYQSIANSYEAIQMVDSAMYYLKLSNHYSQKINALDVVVENYQSMIEIQSQLSDSEPLKYAIVNYLSISDSIMDQYKEMEALEASKVSEFFRIYNRALSTREEYETLKRYNDQLTTIIASLAVLLSISLLIIIYRYYSRKQLAIINQDLRQKNEVLANYNEMITESNQKNELLLKELHHRVKNNLQIVSSLFRLQMNAKSLNEENKEVFKLAQDRIHSISLLHKKIYQSEVISDLDFKSYLEELSSEVVNSNENLRVTLDIPNLQMNIDTALPLGLIFNELFTNSIKHAEVDDELLINLGFENHNDTSSFVYRDNGKQPSGQIFKHLKKDSLGKELIELLSKQIEAKLTHQQAEGVFGFELRITGPFN